MNINILILLVVIILTICIILIIITLLKKKVEKTPIDSEEPVISTEENPFVDVPLRTEVIESIESTTERTNVPDDDAPKVITVRYIETTGKDEYYKEKLSDKRWRDKSNEIKRAQGYRCKVCNSLGEKLVELENIDDLLRYTDFFEVYDEVKRLFQQKSEIINRFETEDSSIVINLQDYSKKEFRFDSYDHYLNTYKKVDMFGHNFNREFFTKVQFKDQEIKYKDEYIEIELPYFAKDKKVEKANSIKVEYIQQGKTNNKIILRHRFDYANGFIKFRGQGILSQDCFSIIFPLYELEKKSLNVHHLAYYEGLEPWECPDDELITLCYNCHMKAHEKKIPEKRYVN